MTGPLPWVGGKNRLARQIIALFPPHQTYVEPFAGGAQVFFHKPPSNVEVLNDLDGEIVNFYRVCQWHAEELARYLRHEPASRRLYELQAASRSEALTDIQRAARFFYLQKNTFGGLVAKQDFHYSVIQRPNYRPERIPAIIERTQRRLQGVQVECLPYEQILEKYDRTSTLFYLDPPYWGRKLYRFNFQPEDFQALQRCLNCLEGKFILSLNDHPAVRGLFRHFEIRTTQVAYSAKRFQQSKYPEVLITNFKQDRS